MTNDEILELKDTITGKEPTDTEMIEFARAIEERTLINHRAKWYLAGAETEREACARIVDVEMDEWDGGNVNVALNNVAAEIRARGK